MNIFRLLIICGIGFLQLSCQPKINDIASLNEFIKSEKNGLIVKKKIHEIDVTMKYLPWQLIALRYRTKEDKNDTVINKLSKNCFFLLSFSKDGKELLNQLDFSTYSEMVQILSFRMQDKISALSGNNAVPVQDCSFQQTFGLSSANELLIAFEADKIKSVTDLKIEVNEFGLNLGSLVFDFNVHNIKTLRALNYKEL